ncbi:SMP-30/gluconolactonase/LRE family protein [Exilibacterium tricleocarpae]|uniref:SMP-30/gluconolactonase/LRE family protein n=1 Tax=Exilibacterium tricleocarpae TaxID=2591008 RepID=A0A545TS96_9GAMM|nr:SMP-30/gluconolactonase/LRE family protein [Exilibacterium tricleocarpae]TQV80097.1 SMP-30/gluconolactonase/LRE family protein [Exilibacterium tricleocarpae]
MKNEANHGDTDNPPTTANAGAHCVWQLESALGEGIVWCPDLQALLWTDILGHRLYYYQPTTGSKATWTLPEPLTCIVPCIQGGYLATFPSGLYLCQLKLDGEKNFSRLMRLASLDQEPANNRPNDGCCDYWGNLWFGTMDSGEKQPSGAFYHYSALGGLRKVVDGIAITNGPVITPPTPSADTGDAKETTSRIYYTDTVQQTLFQATITAAGELYDARSFYQFSPADGYPDGMTIDAEHHLWCCLWGGGRIVRISPAGSIVDELPLPVSQVTKCAFAGAGQTGLYAVTARKGLDATALAGQPLAGSLFYLPTVTGGLPTARFALSD